MALLVINRPSCGIQGAQVCNYKLDQMPLFSLFNTTFRLLIIYVGNQMLETVAKRFLGF